MIVLTRVFLQRQEPHLRSGAAKLLLLTRPSWRGLSSSSAVTPRMVPPRTNQHSPPPSPVDTWSLRDPNPELVDTSQAPANFVRSLAVVYRDFCTQEEADCLMRDVEGCLKRYVGTSSACCRCLFSSKGKGLQDMKGLVRFTD
jgi:hypothetical protein